MRAVIVDAGNTRVAFAAWAEGDSGGALLGNGCWLPLRPLRRLGALPTPQGPDDDAAFLAGVASLLAGCPGQPVVLVSVVPRVDRLFIDAFPGLIRVDHTADLPFRHRLHEPSATGADRLCNIAAAVVSGLRDALIVDAGTATTVDLLCGGVFEGGVIAPGMAFSLQQLGARAARLGPVAFANVPLVAGRDTASAMAAGGFHAGRGGVEALIAGLLAAHGPRDVVVTGGLGRYLVAPGRFHDPDWTLRGAAALAGFD